MLRFIHHIQPSSFKASLNMHNYCHTTQNSHSNSHTAFPSAILHHSLTPSLLPISPVPIFMWIRFVLTSSKNFSLATSQDLSHERNWNSRSETSISHLCKWPRRKDYLANQSNTTWFRWISHVLGESNGCGGNHTSTSPLPLSSCILLDTSCMLIPCSSSSSSHVPQRSPHYLLIARGSHTFITNFNSQYLWSHLI